MRQPFETYRKILHICEACQGFFGKRSYRPVTEDDLPTFEASELDSSSDEELELQGSKMMQAY